VTESKIVNEWIAQGEAKGRVTALLELLADKFTTVPPEVETAIRGTTAQDRLRAWAATAAKAANIDEFRQQAGI
jgi:hypothetical protein